MFVDVILERVKVRRERQDAKRRVEESKQEAEPGSVRTAEDIARFTSQLDNGQHKDTEAKEDTSSQGKSEVDSFVYRLLLNSRL